MSLKRARFPDIFNRRKLADLEKRVKAIESWIVAQKRANADNIRPDPVTLSNPEEGEVWLKK